MNLLMSGMLLTRFAARGLAGGDDPANPRFWFILSIALTIGVVFAYPINWWLVTHHTKHGMLTVREKSVGSHEGHGGHTGHGMSGA